MNKGNILKIKYGYNPNSSDVGSETSGVLSEVLKNALNGSANASAGNTTTLAHSTSSTLATLLKNATAKATTSTTSTPGDGTATTTTSTLAENAATQTTHMIHRVSTTLQQAASDASSWDYFVQTIARTFDLARYLLTAAITLALIYFTARRVSRAIRKEAKNKPS